MNHPAGPLTGADASERPNRDFDTRHTPQSERRLLAGWAETGERADLAEHRRRYGPLTLPAGPGGRLD
jgi:hypothetical protein